MFRCPRNGSPLPSPLFALALALAVFAGDAAHPAGKPGKVEAKEIRLTEETPTQIREAIIALIEDDLAEAYSFNPKSIHKLPHFEVLDRLFPKWHGGKPAVARQFWLDADYETFRVYYRVDYVRVVNDSVAEVEGKRLILWSDQEDGPDLDRYWPFQLWASLPKRSQRNDSYLSAMYAMRYKMKLTRNEKAEWVISEETLQDNPEMVNNLKNHCAYEEQLANWGLRNDCNRKLLPE